MQRKKRSGTFTSSKSSGRHLLLSVVVLLACLALASLAAKPCKPGEPRKHNLGGGRPFEQVVSAFLHSLPGFRLYHVELLTDDDPDNNGTELSTDSWIFPIALAIACMLIVPIIMMCCGCCFPCCFYTCRYVCSCCGGSKPREEGYHWRQQQFNVLGLLITSGLIVSFAVVGNVYNAKINNAINYTVEDVFGSADNLLCLAIDIVDGLFDIAVGVGNTFSGLDSILSGSDEYRNQSLGESINRKLQPIVDNLTDALTALQVQKIVTLNLTAALADDMDQIKADTAAVEWELRELDWELGNASTRSIVHPWPTPVEKTYTIPVPDVSGIADGLPDISDDETLRSAEGDLRELPNFYQVRDDVNASWLNASALIDDQVGNADQTLNETMEDMIDGVRGALDTVSAQIEDGRDQLNDVRKDAKDIQALYNQYDFYRVVLFTVPGALAIFCVGMGLLGLFCAYSRGDRCNKCFTGQVWMASALIVCFWFIFLLYFPFVYTFDTACYVTAEVWENDSSLVPATGHQLYDECTQEDGNIFNTKATNLTKLLEQNNVFDQADSLKSSISSTLSRDEAFDFGGNDLGGQLFNASNANFNSFNFSSILINVTDNIPYNLTEVLIDTRQARLGITPATFNWTQSTVYDALDYLNAKTSEEWQWFSLLNYTTLNVTTFQPGNRVEVAYRYDYLDAMYNFNRTIYNVSAEVRRDIYGIELHIVEIDGMVQDLQEDINYLDQNLTILQEEVAKLQQYAANANEAQIALIEGIDAEMNSTVESINVIVLGRLDNTIDNSLAIVYTFGSCGAVGQFYGDVWETDICTSLVGSAKILWACCAILGLILWVHIYFAVRNSKRAGNYYLETYDETYSYSGETSFEEDSSDEEGRAWRKKMLKDVGTWSDYSDEGESFDYDTTYST